MSGVTDSQAGRTRLPVRLEPVTKANWEYVIALRLADAQAANLASNLYSVAEAYVEPGCRPYAIVAGQTVVGFVMYEYLAYAAACNIPRFMIDIRWQGHGYGRAGLAALIALLAETYPEAAVLISLLPENRSARTLYESLDFVDTGQRVQGEMIMRRAAPHAVAGN